MPSFNWLITLWKFPKFHKPQHLAESILKFNCMIQRCAVDIHAAAHFCELIFIWEIFIYFAAVSC
jgi:hypothetical protein